MSIKKIPCHNFSFWSQTEVLFCSGSLGEKKNCLVVPFAVEPTTPPTSHRSSYRGEITFCWKIGGKNPKKVRFFPLWKTLDTKVESPYDGYKWSEIGAGEMVFIDCATGVFQALGINRDILRWGSPPKRRSKKKVPWDHSQFSVSLDP